MSYTYTTLDNSLANSHETIAADINDTGQIVGWYDEVTSARRIEHGFVFSGGTYTPLLDLGSGTLPTGINDLISPH